MKSKTGKLITELYTKYPKIWKKFIGSSDNINFTNHYYLQVDLFNFLKKQGLIFTTTYNIDKHKFKKAVYDKNTKIMKKTNLYKNEDIVHHQIMLKACEIISVKKV